MTQLSQGVRWEHFKGKMTTDSWHFLPSWMPATHTRGREGGRALQLCQLHKHRNNCIWLVSSLYGNHRGLPFDSLSALMTLNTSGVMHMKPFLSTSVWTVSGWGGQSSFAMPSMLFPHTSQLFLSLCSSATESMGSAAPLCLHAASAGSEEDTNAEVSSNNALAQMTQPCVWQQSDSHYSPLWIPAVTVRKMARSPQQHHHSTLRWHLGLVFWSIN